MRGSIQYRAFRLIQLSMLMLAGAIVSTPSGFGAAAVLFEPEPAAADSGSISNGKFSLNYRIEGTGPPAIVIGSPPEQRRVCSGRASMPSAPPGPTAWCG